MNTNTKIQIVKGVIHLGEEINSHIKINQTDELVQKIYKANKIADLDKLVIKEVIIKEAGTEALSFIKEYILLENQKTILLTTKQQSYVNGLDLNSIRSIVDLLEVNRHQEINSFFRSINTLLPDAGFYISCVEPYHIRKRKMWRRFGKGITKMIWALDFVFNRVLPRLKVTGKLHYLITRNKNRVISLTETLGRLVYCGFDIIEYREIDDKVYFVVLKTGAPKISDTASKGLFFKMKRIGKNGETIGVYKLRTMHPYSEYLQKYVIQSNGYNEFGKVKSDFRVTVWSRFIRKFYLDELPQLINVLKREMNLVGVRPLSKVSFDLLPDDLKIERIKYRPGCIPPYIALRKKGLEGVLESERIYLNEMKIAPLKTNIKYFFKAIFNLLLFRISSN